MAIILAEDSPCRCGQVMEKKIKSDDLKIFPTKVLFIRRIYHRSRKETRTKGSGRNPTLDGSLSGASPPSLLGTLTRPRASRTAPASAFQKLVFSASGFMQWERERPVFTFRPSRMRSEVKNFQRRSKGPSRTVAASSRMGLQSLDLELSLSYGTWS